MRLKVCLMLVLFCLSFSMNVYADDLKIEDLGQNNVSCYCNCTKECCNGRKEFDTSKSKMSNDIFGTSLIGSKDVLLKSGFVAESEMSCECCLNYKAVLKPQVSLLSSVLEKTVEDYIEVKKEEAVKAVEMQGNSVFEIVEEFTATNHMMGNFSEEVGVFQGPWGDLTDYVYQLTGRRKTKSLELLEHVGKKPINESAGNYTYVVDRWRDKNGKGTVRYSQGGATLEDWAYLSSGDSNFVSSACGAYSAACVLSTMLGKYINVPEVSLAVNTYELRHPGSDLVMCNSDGDGAGAFKHTDLAAVIEECGLKTQVSDYFNQEMVDNCLNNGGMVIYVVNSGYGRRYTGNAHYIVIREKTETGYLVYSSTNWASEWNDDYCNTENTAQELKNLQGYNGAQMVCVTY